MRLNDKLILHAKGKSNVINVIPQYTKKQKLLLLNNDSLAGKLFSKPGSTARMRPDNLSTNFQSTHDPADLNLYSFMFPST